MTINKKISFTPLQLFVDLGVSVRGSISVQLGQWSPTPGVFIVNSVSLGLFLCVMNTSSFFLVSVLVSFFCFYP